MSSFPFSQSNMKPSNEKNNKKNRGSRFRSMLPSLLMNVAVPLLIDIVAQRYISTIDALLLASVVPALFTLGNFVVKKHVDFLGILSIISLLLSAVIALLFNIPRLLLIQTSSVIGILGLLMLISLLFPRPALWYLARSLLAQNDPPRHASFNFGWSNLPQYRSFYRTLTAVWGSVTVANLLLQATLAFTLPIPVVLVLNPLLVICIMTLTLGWSVRTVNKNKPLFDHVRQQTAPYHN
jgi:hypothetical protein